MSHVRALDFDALEARKLLSVSHRPASHTRPAVVAAPVVLNGTLAVDNGAANSTSNPDGSTTTSTPVVGNLGSLGKVRGVWNTNVDQFGDTSGPNVLRLAVPNGSLIIVFNTQNSVKPRLAAHGALSYARAQQVYSGTGAYAGAVESGMIDLTTNHARNQINSLVLTSTSA